MKKTRIRRRPKVLYRSPKSRDYGQETFRLFLLKFRFFNFLMYLYAPSSFRRNICMYSALYIRHSDPSKMLLLPQYKKGAPKNQRHGIMQHFRHLRKVVRGNSRNYILKLSTFSTFTVWRENTFHYKS